MTVSEIYAAVRLALDDAAASGVPASDDLYNLTAEMLASINEGQQQFALLTLCLETSGTVALTSGTCFYSIRDSLTGYLVPLRMAIAGARLEPARMTDLDARYYDWAATSGTPARYMQAGMNLLAIVPQQTGSATLTVLYAKEPAVLTTGTDTPEIPAEYHPALVKYALYYLLQKRGGQYLSLALEKWEEFLEAAAQCAEFIRTRYRARQYDTLPAEIKVKLPKEAARG
jgi:hypothetical protein